MDRQAKKRTQKPKGKKNALQEFQQRKKTAAAYKKTKEDLAATIKHTAGGHGKESRDPSLLQSTNGTGTLVCKTQVSQVQISAFCDNRSIWMLAYGPIAMAFQRGWLASPGQLGQGGAPDAYQAFNYLITAFYTAMKGTFPALQAAPVWFWETCAALKTKGARFKTGDIQYSWVFSEDLPNPLILYGAGYSIFFGVPTAATVNDFPVLAAPPAYDPILGEKAVSQLFSFMNDQGMCKVVERGQLVLERDTSAFASTYPEWGQSVSGSGALALTLQHEVKIQNPIFSKFAQYQPNGVAYWRGFQEARKGAGSSCYIIPRMIDMLKPAELRNKASPVFKYYNFDEYFLILSYILGLASERIANDSSQTNVPTCPLTSQQVQLLLRQNLMPRFYNGYAQDLVSVANNAPALVPFCTGPNGNSVSQVTAMKLPFVFVENIRCATRRLIRLQDNYILDAVPVLCRTPDIPQLANFTFTGRSGTQLLYAEVPGEVPVDIIDLSYDNHTNYLTVTGQPLAVLTETWNEYITSLGNSLTTLCTIGVEPGISALVTTFCTRHISAIPQINLTPNTATVQATIALQKKHSKSDVKRGAAVPSRSKVGAPAPVPGQSDQYTFWSPRQITSSDPFYASLWRYSSAFVQPVSFAAEAQIQEATPSFQQVFQVEPFSMPYSDLSTYVTNFNTSVTMDSVALLAAQLDIKTNLAAPSEVEVELSAMAQGGRGGFFTSLAGAIGEGLGIPGAKEIASMVGQVTGL